MSNMLRKKTAQWGTCPAGENCCSKLPMNGRGHAKTKKMQKRMARRRETANWKNEES